MQSKVNVKRVGNGEVVLIAGGGKVYTDIAARFCRTEKDVHDIIASPYNKKLVQTILDSGHYAATEFDYFIFGIQGYSRVTETQLVRKRLASYLIKSGRAEEHGKRNFDVVLPKDQRLLDLPRGEVHLDPSQVIVEYKDGVKISLEQVVPCSTAEVYLNSAQLLDAMASFYDDAVLNHGIKEEDARYFKPQATEFKAIIGMNAHALRDWFKIRCCNRAQSEIRDLAWKMLRLCKEVAPDLFEGAGPSCVALGLCPEMEQCEQNKGKIPTLKAFKEAKNTKEYQDFAKVMMK